MYYVTYAFLFLQWDDDVDHPPALLCVKKLVGDVRTDIKSAHSNQSTNKLLFFFELKILKT